MKIGIVLSSSPGYSETFLTSKISGLQKQGHTVVLFCQDVRPDFSLCKTVILPNSSTRSVYLPFKVIYTYLSLLFYIKSVYRFYQLEQNSKVPLKTILKKLYFNAAFLKSKLDWLHYGFGTLAIGREHIAQATGSKMAVSFRGFDIGVYPIKHPNCYDALWKTVDVIHVISNDIKALLYKNNFKDEAPVIKITPAIDIDFFNSTEKFLLKEDTKQFITIARLHWKKGLDYTLEALALLKNEGVKFHYTIIGDGIELEHLKFTVHQLGLKEYVTFTGKLDKNEIKERLQTSSIYIQYSVQEGFCNAVLEAQAMGLLCVVSDAEGLAENVLDGTTGWVVAKRQPKVLTNKLIEMISLPNKEKAKVMELSKNRIKQVFNLEKQQKLFETFYDDNI